MAWSCQVSYHQKKYCFYTEIFISYFPTQYSYDINIIIYLYVVDCSTNNINS